MRPMGASLGARWRPVKVVLAFPVGLASAKARVGTKSKAILDHTSCLGYNHRCEE